MAQARIQFPNVLNQTQNIKRVNGPIELNGSIHKI